jgi:hypothetical protein
MELPPTTMPTCILVFRCRFCYKSYSSQTIVLTGEKVLLWDTDGESFCLEEG